MSALSAPQAESLARVIKSMRTAIVADGGLPARLREVMESDAENLQTILNNHGEPNAQTKS